MVEVFGQFEADALFVGEVHAGVVVGVGTIVGEEVDEGAEAVAYKGVDDGAVGVAGLQFAAFAAVAEGAFKVPTAPVFADVYVQLVFGELPIL